MGELVAEILNSWPGNWCDQSDPHAHHEAKLLQLSTDKANALLGWSPVWRFAEAIRETVGWYRETEPCKGEPVQCQSLTHRQIAAYTAAARAAMLPWTQTTP